MHTDPHFITYNVVDPVSGKKVKLYTSTLSGDCELDVSAIDAHNFPNIVYVDPENIGVGCKPGNGLEGSPYGTLQEALDNSTTGDLIWGPPGDYSTGTGGADLVVPHDVYVNIPGATGIGSIDISAGRIKGRIGKIEYNETGCIIHADSNYADNGACLKLAMLVGVTQNTTRWAVGMTGGAEYHYPDATLQWSDGVDFSTTNSDLLDLYGIGVSRPVLTGPAGGNLTFQVGSFALDWEGSFKNFEILGTFSTGIRPNTNWTGEFSDIKVVGATCGLSGGTHTFNGQCVNVETTGTVFVTGSGATNGALNSGSIKGLNCARITMGSFSGHLELLSGDIDVNDDVTSDALIELHENASVSVENNGTEIFDALVKCGSHNEFLGRVDGLEPQRIKGRFFGVSQNVNIPASNGIQSFGRNYFTEDFSLRDSLIGNFGLGAGSVGVHGVIERSKFDNVRFVTSWTAHDYKQLENFGIFDHCVFEQREDIVNNDITIPVTDGAKFVKCTFKNFGGDAIRGWNPLDTYGDGAPNTALWDFSEQKLVLPCSTQPLKSDGAGTRAPMPSGTTFNATIYNDSGLGAGLVGLFVEFEVFDDAGTWVIRSTATNAIEIDNALGNPVADIIGNQADDFQIGIEATITMIDCVFCNGGTVGQEITFSLDSFERSENSICLTDTRDDFRNGKHLKKAFDYAVSKNSDTITSVTDNGGQAVMNDTNHGLLEGATVTITGMTEPLYNGKFVISNVTNNTFEIGVAYQGLTDTGTWESSALTPNGLPLSVDNPYTIFLEQGVYELALDERLTVDQDFIRILAKDYIKPSAVINALTNRIEEAINTGVIVRGRNNVFSRYAILHLTDELDEFITQGISWDNALGGNPPSAIWIDATSRDVVLKDTYVFPNNQDSLYIAPSEVTLENVVNDGQTTFVDLQGNCRDIYSRFTFGTQVVSGTIRGEFVFNTPSSILTISGFVENLRTNTAESLNITGEVENYYPNSRYLWEDVTGLIHSIKPSSPTAEFLRLGTFDGEIRNCQSLYVSPASGTGTQGFLSNAVILNSNLPIGMPRNGYVQNGALLENCFISSAQTTASDSRIRPEAHQGSYGGRLVNVRMNGGGTMPALHVGHRAEIFGGVFESNSTLMPVLTAQRCLPDLSLGWTKTATTITVDLNASHGITNADKVPVELIDFNTVDPDGIDAVYTDGIGGITLDFDTSPTQVIISGLVGQTAGNYIPTGSINAGVLPGQTLHQEQVKFHVSATIVGAVLLGNNPIIDPDITLL
jgi:hypothetical protein